LPSINEIELASLLNQTTNLRDKALISLLADSGMRLSEAAYVKRADIDWSDNTIIIWGKGNKQRRAPFTERTGVLLKELISRDGSGGNIWRLSRRGIQSMLNGYREKTHLPCNAHTSGGRSRLTCTGKGWMWST
jgi:integrase